MKKDILRAHEHDGSWDYTIPHVATVAILGLNRLMSNGMIITNDGSLDYAVNTNVSIGLSRQTAPMIITNDGSLDYS